MSTCLGGSGSAVPERLPSARSPPPRQPPHLPRAHHPPSAFCLSSLGPHSLLTLTVTVRLSWGGVHVHCISQAPSPAPGGAARPCRGVANTLLSPVH